MLIHAPEDEFLIGDTSVIPAALGSGETEAMKPLFPTPALLLHQRLATAASLSGDDLSKPACQRACLNMTMVQNAEREVFSRAPIEADFLNRHLGTRQIRLAPGASMAAGDRRTGGPMLDRSGE